jgi:hypothetical protein
MVFVQQAEQSLHIQRAGYKLIEQAELDGLALI